jgi:hypothetical protein
MSPTHSNKRGARYRYYVSHALLQNRKQETGSVRRILALEIEQLVLDGVRARLRSLDVPIPAGDRELIERHVERIVVTPQATEVHFLSMDSRTQPADHESPRDEPVAMLSLPWAAASFVAVKGIVHEPTARRALSPETRDALLAAIAKARSWIENLRRGRVATLADIANRGSLGERHVRLLAPLAFVSPRLIAAIADGTAPPDLTVTGLAQRLPDSWAQQERRVGFV